MTNREVFMNIPILGINPYERKNPPLNFEEEGERTKESLADVVQLLSHDTSPTRLQLARTLRERASIIETEFENDRFLNSIPGE